MCVRVCMHVLVWLSLHARVAACVCCSVGSAAPSLIATPGILRSYAQNLHSTFLCTAACATHTLTRERATVQRGQRVGSLHPGGFAAGGVGVGGAYGNRRAGNFENLPGPSSSNVDASNRTQVSAEAVRRALAADPHLQQRMGNYEHRDLMAAARQLQRPAVPGVAAGGGCVLEGNRGSGNSLVANQVLVSCQRQALT